MHINSLTAYKHCSRCNMHLEASMFYKQKHSADGLHAWCKSCGRNYGLEYKTKNREYIRNRDRIRDSIPSVRAAKLKAKNKWQINNLHKRRAHWRIYRAVKAGKITRPNKCERCLNICKPNGHHDDYNKPLEIMWLCQLCHKKRHIELGDIISKYDGPRPCRLVQVAE